jgi:CubicO group peptidase (beta-lactamase class C family)
LNALRGQIVSPFLGRDQPEHQWTRRRIVAMRDVVIARKILFPLFLAAAVCASGDEVDRYVLAQMDKQHIPGLSMAVLRHGKAVRSQGYGFANVERKIAVTRDTVFQLQSSPNHSPRPR